MQTQVSRIEMLDVVKVRPEYMAEGDERGLVKLAIKSAIARLRARNWEAGRACRAAIWAARKLYGWGLKPWEWRQVTQGKSDFYWGNWVDYALACDARTLTNRHWSRYDEFRGMTDKMMDEIYDAAREKYGHTEMLIQVG